MAWTELQKLPDEYNERFQSIDETILKLTRERNHLAKGKRFFPPKEIIREWAARYEMDVPQINWFLHSINHFEPPIRPDEPGELLNVIPVMKKTTVDGFEYLITHAMQHEHESIVNVEIRSEAGNHADHIRPKLLLDVQGDTEYRVRSRGSRGGGGQAQLNFSVNPRLPDDVQVVRFALIPFASPMDTPPQETILDREVLFE